ncbi:MAG: hypothetical protein MPEBLZ_02206 [Candidatus Methanoperedens nitroreducens]|uniref:DUF4386 domain-containing protein n=1 Tax=Candidatus Methanoperedens nitratireducens TaxID=1392998 RepID=A0A0P7ZEV2_9EURY|nr:DUF4386 domain-containing protein [Candidatus Methanoperedens sp. BLZ2]KAB2947256.1 MAG: DUF4386 domain-containing protein [Candidatus Methanoperedens sp.]KPQ43248.1 MAG: hypothetical protein MPEBLZ_02206 [Candidatus Methanoperedens sp. BLZ1]MBZ0175399.1 DUF4386 domain-containing protein [Candidatus Methanoperedens nitroreducens]MCX9079661.1 DUF4386 domain-containing protein [Candidatus Methanoperedens sp.]
MNSNKKIARTTGILFIIATAAVLLGSGLTESIVGAPDYLVQIAANKNLVALGAILYFVAAAGSAGIAISLYPVLRKYNEGLAIGSVGFRLIEAVFYIVSALGLLSLLSLSQEYASAEPQAVPTFQVLGTSILAMRVWAGFVLAVIAFCLGAAMYYYVMYRFRLIPRWLSVWGLVALTLLLLMTLLIAFGERISGPSGMQVLLVLPILVQEMVLAVWLIVKGFNPSAIASGSPKTDTNEVK